VAHVLLLHGRAVIQECYFFVANVLAAASKDRRCGAHHPACKEHIGGMCRLLHEPRMLAARLPSSAGSVRERKAE